MTKQIRKFEVVSKYKDKGINPPIRKTKYSAGYDVESAVDIIIPSSWQRVFSFINKGDYKSNEEVNSMIQERLDNGQTIKDIMKEFNLSPTLIPTGLKVYMHDDEVLDLLSRSGTPRKWGLIVSNSMGEIDADYVDTPYNEGKMFIQVLNFLPFDVTIKKGEPIAQGIFRKYLVTDDDVAEGESVSGIGSTDEQ